MPNVRALSYRLRETVLRWAGIPVCVGIGPTKTLAKLANHIAKKHPRSRGVFNHNDLTPAQQAAAAAAPLVRGGDVMERAASVRCVLLDKTGTITLGSRQAVEFLTAAGVSEGELADAAQLSSLADETPEGRSIVALAQGKYGVKREGALDDAKFVELFLGLVALNAARTNVIDGDWHFSHLLFPSCLRF